MRRPACSARVLLAGGRTVCARPVCFGVSGYGLLDVSGAHAPSSSVPAWSCGGDEGASVSSRRTARGVMSTGAGADMLASGEAGACRARAPRVACVGESGAAHASRLRRALPAALEVGVGVVEARPQALAPDAHASCGVGRSSELGQS